MAVNWIQCPVLRVASAIAIMLSIRSIWHGVRQTKTVDCRQYRSSLKECFPLLVLDLEMSKGEVHALACNGPGRLLS